MKGTTLTSGTLQSLWGRIKKKFQSLNSGHKHIAVKARHDFLLTVEDA